jgi:hypothetical protein
VLLRKCPHELHLWRVQVFARGVGTADGIFALIAASQQETERLLTVRLHHASAFLAQEPHQCKSLFEHLIATFGALQLRPYPWRTAAAVNTRVMPTGSGILEVDPSTPAVLLPIRIRVLPERIERNPSRGS